MIIRIADANVDPVAAEYIDLLHDTIVLLGLDARFATLLKNPEYINQQDVEDLRLYKENLRVETKERLFNIIRAYLDDGAA